MNLYTDLWFPIIYTTIGAVIGGIIAYKIAKENVTLNRINEGIIYIFLLKKDIDDICKNIEDLQDHICKRTTCDDNHFLIGLFEKNEKLIEHTRYFRNKWQQYNNEVWACCTKQVCKNLRRRKLFSYIAEHMENIYNLVIVYDDNAKKYENEHDKCLTREEKEHGRVSTTYLSKPESEKILQTANDILNKISSNCKAVQEKCEGL